MINLWIAFGATATAAIEAAADGEAGLPSEVQAMVLTQRAVYDSNTTGSLFASPGGWQVYNVYLADDQVDGWAATMPVLFGAEFRILGAWDYATGAQAIAPVADLIDFMPSAELTQVVLLSEQAERVF